MSKGSPTVTYRITLPESGEDLGKWLERNNARIEIYYMLGKYTVSITKNFPGGHSESGNISISKRSEISVNAHGDRFTETFTDALRRANGVQL